MQDSSLLSHSDSGGFMSHKYDSVVAVASARNGGDILRNTTSNELLTTDIVRAQDDHRNGNVASYEAASANNGCPLETMM